MTSKPHDATPPTKEGEVVAEKEKVFRFSRSYHGCLTNYEITMAPDRQVATHILFRNE